MSPRVEQCEPQLALQEEGGMEEARELLGAQEDESQRSGAVLPRVARAAGAALALAFGCTLAAVSIRRSSGGPAHAAAGSSVELFDGNPNVAMQVAAVRASHPGWDPYYWDELVDGKKASGALSPNENLSDGNTCREDEEEFGGLCYKKCNILTNNEYPIRTTAFTCCKDHPCHPFNSRKDMGFCSGFSVGGGEGSSCPHTPGSCLTDEEMLLGRCFKKCSVLTNDEFPHRLTNYACCKVKLGYKCMFPGNIRVRKSFDVGGGKGDNDESTPGDSHAPIPELTES